MAVRKQRIDMSFVANRMAAMGFDVVGFVGEAIQDGLVKGDPEALTAKERVGFALDLMEYMHPKLARTELHGQIDVSLTEFLAELPDPDDSVADSAESDAL